MIGTENLDFKTLMQNQKQISKNLRQKNEAKILEYDFKIVSFKLAGEYYGIDIMSVKEILKAKKFTHVPNALDFVIGVFNLRGEIMPIIDLAKMFHLEPENKSEIKSIIIIKVDNLLIGLAVDEISHVLPLRRADIQPPSPLLGTINERYIEGVVELNDKLYVILDADAIFSDKEKAKKDILPQSSDLAEELFTFFCNQMEELNVIHITEFNKKKFRELFTEYVKENNITEMPNLTKENAENILKKFFSKYTSQLWQQPYTDHFLDAVIPKLNRICSDEVRALNIGCASGHEAFSLYFLLVNNMKDAEIKLIAADINLIAVSNASGFEINGTNIPSWINREKYFMKLSDGKYKVKKEIADKIYFEFHNALNISTYNRVFDLVVARDISLYMTEDEYKKFLKDISAKIVSGGVLVVGDNEDLGNLPDFTKVPSEYLSVYVKN
ncbi:MAG TPA: chemotaxis protein CheW [Spirochaetota bacterium]|nr:chemotaxis protein CheW [Spirochaetota bacterium]HOL56292.1 chemotaxis protein CheW [Spirochaetota bacterium]HPP03682.1 chemotaxis protein CheW [Spirochaetota bacterium]